MQPNTQDVSTQTENTGVQQPVISETLQDQSCRAAYDPADTTAQSCFDNMRTMENISVYGGGANRAYEFNSNPYPDLFEGIGENPGLQRFELPSAQSPMIFTVENGSHNNVSTPLLRGYLQHTTDADWDDDSGSGGSGGGGGAEHGTGNDQGNTANPMFNQLDGDKNGRINAKEWIDRNLQADSNKDGDVTLEEMYTSFGRTGETKKHFDGCDANGDGKASSQELVETFLKADQNKDSGIDKTEYDRHQGGEFGKIDANGDKKVSAKEWVDSFDAMDKEKDGTVSLDQMYEKLGHTEKTKQLFDKLNTTGDDRVDAREWLSGFVKAESASDQNSELDEKEFDDFLKREEKDTFGQLDKNGDSKIDIQEWVDKHSSMDADRDGKVSLDDMYKALGQSDLTKKLFDKANDNGDQFVDMSEWLRAYLNMESKQDKDFFVGKQEFDNFVGKQKDPPGGGDKPPGDDKPPGEDKPPGDDKPPDGGDKPPDGGGGDVDENGIKKATDAQIKTLSDRIKVESGVSDAFVKEVKDSLKNLPSAVAQALIDTNSQIWLQKDSNSFAPGAAGTFEPGINRIRVFERQSRGMAGVVFGAEAAHAFDLEVAHISDSPEFQKIWQNRRGNPPGGFHTPIEAQMAPLIHLMGYRDGRAEQTLNVLPGLKELWINTIKKYQK
jgi:Ca2+-binding EF-hand superfamily protein